MSDHAGQARGVRGRCASLVAAVVLLALLLPDLPGVHAMVGGHLWDLAHVPAGILLFLGARALPVRWPATGAVWAAVAVLLALVELWQGCWGRQPEWSDWFAGALGAVAAWAWQPRPWRRVAAVVLAIAGVAAALPACLDSAGVGVCLASRGQAPVSWCAGVVQEATLLAGGSGGEVTLQLDGQAYGGVNWLLPPGVADWAPHAEVVIETSPDTVPAVVWRFETTSGERWYRGETLQSPATTLRWDMEGFSPEKRSSLRRWTVFFPNGNGTATVRARWLRTTN